jgi:CheY-like chemotaxis protein
MRILVVDDSPAIQAIIQDWLVRAGWNVVLAADGDEALKLYRRKEPFDAVVTDWIIPVWMLLSCLKSSVKRTLTKLS